MSEPFPLSQCQPLKEDDFAKLKRSAFAMEPKIDGWRIQADIGSEGVVLWTRSNHIATGKAPIVEEHLQRLDDMRLDGEMVVLRPDGTPDYNFTARCLSSSTDVCVNKQLESGRSVTFFAFDILLYKGEDQRKMSYEQRRKLLEQVPESEYVKIMPIQEPSLKQHLLNLEQYEEGSVLKQLNASYPGRRYKTWKKWKYQPTTDAVIIGYKPGQGKYAGLIGAIHFRSEEGIEGFCSGMDDQTRVKISNNRAFLIGKWIEIKHFGRLVDGYRHPQFVRLRPDKS